MGIDKIPVNIISGFLGSGKTTTILDLLKNKMSDDKWAVIINEFGKVSIDSQTLGATSDSGNIFEVSGGCICCSAKGYFQENLEQILSSGNYNRIIIEPSGLGGVDMVSEIVWANNDLRLMQVICLVDILGLEIDKLQRLPIYRNQILKADAIVFTKCDLLEDKLTENRLIEKFKTLYPGKPFYLKSKNKAFWSVFLDIDDGEAPEMNQFRMFSATDHQLTDSNFRSDTYSFASSTIFSVDKVEKFFTNHPQIIRAKGHLFMNTGWMLVNFTLSGSLFEPCEENVKNELIIITERYPAIPDENFKVEFAKTILP